MHSNGGEVELLSTAAVKGLSLLLRLSIAGLQIAPTPSGRKTTIYCAYGFWESEIQIGLSRKGLPLILDVGAISWKPSGLEA